MSGVWAVFSHEMRQRWMIFPCALLLGVLVLAFGDVAIAATPMFFNTLGLILAVILGSKVVNEDLFSGRLSFFFSLPISAASLWAGKVLAALVVVAGAPALIAVPALLFASNPEGFAMAGPWTSTSSYGILAAQLLLIMAVAHVLNLAWRERSIWAVVNLVGAGAVIWLFLVAASRAYLANPDLVRTLRTGSLGWWWVVSGLAIAASVGVASAQQLAHGRTSPRCNHRVFTLVLWSLLVPIGCGIGVYALTTPPPAPEHVDQFEIVLPAPSGSQVFLSGYSPRRGSEDSFLLDTASGKFFYLQRPLDLPPALSADGRRAAFFDVQGNLRFVDAPADSSEDSFEVLSARIRVSEPLLEIALSPNGSLVVLIAPSEVKVYDVETARVLAREPLPGKTTAVRFPEPGLVRLFLAAWGAPNRYPMSIYELSLETGELEQSGWLQGFAWPGQVVVNAAGSLVLRVGALSCGDTTEAEVADRGHYQKAVVDVCLYDGATGAPLADLGEFPEVPLRWARFLADGRLAVLSLERPADAEEGQGVLHIFSPQGAVQRRVDLGPVNSPQVGTQPDAGSLWISAQPGSRLLRVDLDSGTVRQEEGKLSILPLGSTGLQRSKSFKYPPELVMPAAGEPGARLLLSGEGELVLQQEEGQGLRQISLHSIPYTLAPWLQPPAGGPTLSNG